MNTCSVLGPLTGKRFFIDPHVDKAMKLKLKEMLIELGGKVEDFLDKGIHFALTNELNPGRYRKGDNRQRLSPYSQSPFNTSQMGQKAENNKSETSNKWKNIAKQASSRTKDGHSIVDIARNLGIKVRLVADVWAWLSKKTEISKKSSLPASQPPAEIKLKAPCLKVEDGKTKPVYEEFEAFSHLDVTVKARNCPIINVNSRSATHLKEKKNNGSRKGFCECCQCTYLNERKHRKSVQHINYGETISHFDKLDKYATKNELTLQSILMRHQPGKNTATSPCEVASSNKEFTGDSKLPQKKMEQSGLSDKPASSPRRRSPRKLVKMICSPKRRKSIEESSIMHAAVPTKESASNQQVTHFPQSSLSPPNNFHVHLRSHSSFFNSNAGSSSVKQAGTPQNKCFFHPDNCSKKRKRVQSCDTLNSLENSPASRLRSFQRKVVDLDSSPEKQRTQLSFNKETVHSNVAKMSSSENDLAILLRSSSESAFFEPEFFGF